MAEEEKDAQTPEETPEEAPVEEAPAAEDSFAEEAPAAEEAGPAEEPAAEDPAKAPAAEAPAEAEEPVHPKARRKLERSRASGPAREQLTPEQRAAERASRRRAKATARKRYRARTRERRTETGTGTQPAERRPGARKVRQGTVVSSKSDKTITVRIEVVRRHPTYEKVVRRSSTVHAHDESNEAQEGDVVRVVESRPLSRTKRWRLLEVVEKAR